MYNTFEKRGLFEANYQSAVLKCQKVYPGTFTRNSIHPERREFPYTRKRVCNHYNYKRTNLLGNLYLSFNSMATFACKKFYQTPFFFLLSLSPSLFLQSYWSCKLQRDRCAPDMLKITHNPRTMHNMTNT